MPHPQEPHEDVCLLSDLHGPDDLVLGQVWAEHDVSDLITSGLKMSQVNFPRNGQKEITKG